MLADGAGNCSGLVLPFAGFAALRDDQSEGIQNKLRLCCRGHWASPFPLTGQPRRTTNQQSHLSAGRVICSAIYFTNQETSLLRWRLLSSAILLTILLSLACLDFQRTIFGVAGIWLSPAYLLVSVLATREILNLVSLREFRPVAWPVYLGTFAVSLAPCVPMLLNLLERRKLLVDITGWGESAGQFALSLVGLALGAFFIFLAEMRRYRQPGTATVNIALSLLTLVYIGVLWGFIPLLRRFYDNGWGMMALASAILIVKACDAGAYFTGRFLGRHKMSPILSPKKTVEGAVGGLVVACLSCGAFFYLAGPALVGESFEMPSLPRWLGYSLAVAIAGMFGDLAESLLKRDMGSKDAGNQLPGLGGVLDVIDSVLFAAPVAYACWVMGLVGPG
jgi:phosphatidate cytidylyltransferase